MSQSKNGEALYEVETLAPSITYTVSASDCVKAMDETMEKYGVKFRNIVKAVKI